MGSIAFTTALEGRVITSGQGSPRLLGHLADKKPGEDLNSNLVCYAEWPMSLKSRPDFLDLAWFPHLGMNFF